MAQTGKTRNLYGDVLLGDLSLVLVTIDSGGLVTAGSSPDVAVTAAGSGVYNITFTVGVDGWVLGHSPVNSSTDKTAATSFDPTAGTLTLTKSDGADCTGSEEIHAAILISNK